MPDQKYYDILHNIADDHTVNHTGVMVGGVLPFHKDSDAVKFVMRKFPEASAEHPPIKIDPDAARAAAGDHLYELEYITQVLYDIAHNYLDKRVEYLKKMQDAELQKRSWEVDVYHERAMEYSWSYTGVMDAAEAVQDRVHELLMLGQCPPREWWADRSDLNEDT